MNRRLTSILLSAFLVAAVCSFLVYRLVVNRLAAVAPAKTVGVVAASDDIKLGTVLQDKDLTTVQIAGTLPKGAILTKKDAIGRGVISELHQGEPILDSRLAPLGMGGGLAATIPEGMRAAAVKVDDVVGVAGFVTPGMRVDVLISGTPPGNAIVNDGPKVATLLQNIQVLSAGTDIQKDAEGKPQQVQVVNLLVNPEQAESLSLASNQTKIQLVLRNPLDTKVSQPPGMVMANLFGGKEAPVPHAAVVRRSAPKPASQAYFIEVLNGSKRTEQKFGSGEGK
jgi:pilus assembly protein CpaB